MYLVGGVGWLYNIFMSQKLSLIFKIVVGLMVVATVTTALYTVIAKYKKVPEGTIATEDEGGTLLNNNEVPVNAFYIVSNKFNIPHGDQLESVIVFDTVDSVKDSVSLYELFLKEQGWELVSESTIKGNIFLSAKKGNGSLKISITPAKSPDPIQARITISYVR